jgi:hypothetical protein
MYFTYHRVSRISAGTALATIASVGIVVGVGAIMLVIVGVAASGAALLRAIGAIRPATSGVPVADHATIEGVVVRSTDIADQRI